MASMGSKWSQARETAQGVLELTKVKADKNEDSGIRAYAIHATSITIFFRSWACVYCSQAYLVRLETICQALECSKNYLILFLCS